MKLKNSSRILVTLLVAACFIPGVNADEPQFQNQYSYNPSSKALRAAKRDMRYRPPYRQPYANSSSADLNLLAPAERYLQSMLVEHEGLLKDSNVSSNFKLDNIIQKENLNITLWYQQVKNGVPVLGSQVSIELNPNLEPTSAYMNIAGEVDIDTAYKVPGRAALQIALRMLYSSKHWAKLQIETRRNSSRFCRPALRYGRLAFSRCYRRAYYYLLRRARPEVQVGPELLVYNPKFLNSGMPGKSYLVWELKLALYEGRQVVDFKIDANTGAVLTHGSMETFQQPVRRIYDCSWDEIDACLIDHEFAGYTYGRSEGKPARGINPENGSLDVDKAYDLSLQVHNAYKAFLGRNGANDRGGMGNPSKGVPYDYMQIFTHLNNYAPLSHICDGFETNATNSATTMAFCTGSVLMEVFAHEYAHVVTYYMRYNWDDEPSELLTDPNFLGEVHALHEAFSEFLTEYIQYKIEGTLDWIAGTGTSSVYRSFSDPTSVVNNSVDHDTFPLTYTDPNFYCGLNPRTFAHTNHSIFNHANYLLSVGGMNNGCNIDGIGIDRVAQIWMYALENYFLADNAERFYDAYLHLQAACLELSQMTGSGITASHCEQLTKALQSVHLDKAGGCNCTETVTGAGGVESCAAWAHHPNVGTAEPASCAPTGARAGDFNRDSIVDSKDWRVWFQTKGIADGELSADANGDGIVNDLDCNIWLENFGAGTCVEDNSEGCLEPEYFNGDYDLNGVVNGSDYLKWQRGYGSTDPGNTADGNKNGVVDAADYTIWRNNLGAGNCAMN